VAEQRSQVTSASKHTAAVTGSKVRPGRQSLTSDSSSSSTLPTLLP
jgi:hypothetical protein